MMYIVKKLSFLIIIISISLISFAQFRPKEVNWTNEGNGYTQIKDGGIIKMDLLTFTEKVLVKKEQLIPAGQTKALSFEIYTFSEDNTKVLIYTNTAKVWRYNTRGDYWLLDIPSNKLIQLGKGRPSQSLMFAKLSPDNKKAAYVSEHNIYIEDLATHQVTQLTKDGTRKFINGTFDWVYEEEFDCRDGFRWSPDSRSIAFWQVDATKIRDYYMINYTDSAYSRIIPVEYPKVGEPPSPVRIGVITIANGNIKWMNIPGNPQQNYLPRMQWAANSNELIVQQLNRKQNQSKLFYCNIADGTSKDFYNESDKAWVDVRNMWNDEDPAGWQWINNGAAFLWVTEKDGWRHIYKVSRDGKKETLLTKGNYDIDETKGIDEKNNYVYFMASPNNATQLYLHRVKLDGSGTLEMVSSPSLQGTHEYNISPNAKFAVHSFSNYKTFPASEWISLPDNKTLDERSIVNTMRIDPNNRTEYFTITTDDNITVDGWMTKPANFDSTKKYPVVFYVYTEPAGSTVNDIYGAQRNRYYDGDMSEAGYFVASLDNRGTPSLKGAAWRKAIYKKIGILNIHDQAMAAKKFLDKPWFDKDRVAVWGHSGGGAATLNLMFQHPEIYKTGIALSAITNELNYDNIYTERYMGLPQENMDDYIRASPNTYAKNLQGNLLYIHGTGDDNVQYDNAEMLLNELIKYNKLFQFMPYPNRTHSLREGEGTRKHLSTLYTDYLRRYCPGGPR